MTASLASSPWPPSAAEARHGWRFGREVHLSQDGAAPMRAVQWVLRRHGSISPRQLAGVYLALCGVGLSIGLAFWWQGAPAVMAFAGLELLAVGIALAVVADHAADRETITLAAHLLQVERRFGRRIERAVFRPEWVRVEPAHGERSLVELTGQGQRVRVGRYLRPELRAALAQELRRALRSVRERRNNDDTGTETK